MDSLALAALAEAMDPAELMLAEVVARVETTVGPMWDTAAPTESGPELVVPRVTTPVREGLTVLLQAVRLETIAVLTRRTAVPAAELRGRR